MSGMFFPESLQVSLLSCSRIELQNADRVKYIPVRIMMTPAMR